MGNFALAFMLSSMTARMSQALQINLEYSTDILCKETDRGPSGTLRESRRRLMWCCYVTDSLVGSGVDQLTLIDEEDLKIQLPCNERSFIQQTIRITETLRDRQTLPFIPSDIRSSDYGDNMGIVACFLRLVEVRRRVLRCVCPSFSIFHVNCLIRSRYIKHLDKAKVPWLSDSEFAVLDSECKAWHDSLPPSLQFTPSALFIRQETGQVGALCILHCAYHQTMCDLYRLGAPKLYKLRGAFSFPPEERAFVTHLQWTLFEHAKALARIVEETGRYGTKALADSWLPTITYDSCRIIVYHLTQIIDPSAETSTGLTEQAIPFLEGSLQMLKRMQALYAVAEPLVFIVQLLFLDIIALRSLTRLQYVAAKTMVGKFGLGSEAIRRMKSIIPDDPYRPNPEEAAEGCVFSFLFN